MQQFLRRLVQFCELLLVFKRSEVIGAEPVCTHIEANHSVYPCGLDLSDCTMDCQGIQLTIIPHLILFYAEELNLDDNLITRIEYPPFANLRNLETLRLRNNRIRLIEDGAFNDLVALDFLDLSDNRIAYLEADTFYQLHNLAFFAFEGNPLICSCSMLALKTWIGNRNMAVVPSSCYEVTEIEIEFWKYTNFSSCSADDELFSTELKCSLILDMETDINKVLTEDCSDEYEYPVCYSTISYTNLSMSVTNGCMDEGTCHNIARKNTDTCFNTHGDRDCTFCCLHDMCNENKLGDRTKNISFKADVLFCMEDNHDLRSVYDTRQFVSDIHDVLKISLSSITEFRGFASGIIEDIRTQNMIECDELALICSIWYMTLREIDEHDILKTMKSTLVSAFSKFRYLPYTVLVSLKQDQVPIYCMAEITTDEKGTFCWDTTQIDTYATSYCIAEMTMNVIPVFRRCSNFNDRAIWATADTGVCIDKINTLEDIAAVNISDANADYIAERLLYISSNSSYYTASELTLTTVALEDLLHLDRTPHLHRRGRALVQTIGKLLSVPIPSLIQEEGKKNIAYRLLHLIDELTANIDLSHHDFEAMGSGLAVFALKTSVEEYKGLSCILENRGPSTELRIAEELSSSIDSYIRLPNTLISQLPSEDIGSVTRITGGIFTNDKFFRALETGSGNKANKNHLFLSKTKVNSVIYSVNVPGMRIQNLTDPIEFKVKQIQKNAKNPTCAYFAERSTDKKTWKGDGCYVKMHVPGNYTVCVCDHLTNFALLMDVYGTGAHLSQGHRTALSILSYVGCVISLTGLTLTLLTYCLFRPLRTTRPALILMNLCGALIGLNVVFLIGEHNYAFNSEGICKVVAVFLHYYLLAAIMWMLVEAFYFFMTIVLIWNSHIHRFFLKICVFGWGIPLVIVGVTGIGNNGKNYGLQGGGICWLDQPSFYGAVLAPLCAMLTLNTGVFVTVLRRILGMHSKKLNKTEARQTSQRIRGSLTAIVMLGLTWGITIFAIGNNSASLMFQYLFAVFNSLQGFFIFLFHCILKADVQNVWSKMLCRKKPLALGTSNGTGNMDTFNVSTSPNRSD